MISHKYKCIFLHIPRTGGSSVEYCIYKKDWENVNLETKHITPDMAKKLYPEYWSKYFKFSFVRNPFDWLVSLYTFDNDFSQKMS